ncbi:hypothetical protein G9A89_023017 [Geosiphon pyriformis]|nr:hypothetical protein G9A89_023017 [Geosiphon pyriformis]
MATKAFFLIFITSCLYWVSLTHAVPTKKNKFDTLVVFGDSATDNGNTYKLTNGTWPVSVYYNGRFTNGKVWPEYMAEELNLELLDFAYGGATTDNNLVQGVSGRSGTVKVPSILEQVDLYLATNPTKEKLKTTIAVTWAAGNDYVYSNFTADPKQVVEHLSKSWVKLYNNGIRNLLSPGLPDISVVPYLKNSTTEVHAKLEKLHVVHNQILNAALQKFKKEHQDMRIYTFNPAGYLEALEKNYLKIMGITDYVDACFNTLVDPPTLCETPQSYLFWDPLHQTTYFHKLIAEGFIIKLKL